MTGAEIVPVKAAVAAAKGALGEDQNVKRQLAEMAKDSPAMREAAESFARRVAVRQALLLKLYRPLAKLVGASKAYFETEFAADMSEKIAGIPDDHLRAPPPSVAVPAMQALGYSLDEPDLKEMYLNLLATATDDRKSEKAHPSFAEIIKQLSPREAGLLPLVLRQTLPIVQVQRKGPTGTGARLESNHVIKLADLGTGEPAEETSMAVWVDNWVRLGLVEVDYKRSLVAEGSYDWIEERPEVLRLIELDPRGRDAVKLAKGMLRPTDFGLRFASAVAPETVEVAEGGAPGPS